MMSNLNDVEKLLASDRFEVRKIHKGMNIQLSDNFMKRGVALSNVENVKRVVHFSLEKGHKIFITR